MTLKPTAEQARAVEMFHRGDSMVIEALAGTGKTAALEMIGRSTGKSGQYLAFNRAAVNDAAKRMPDNVVAKTVHALAFREVGAKYQRRLRDSARMRSTEIAARLDIGSLSLQVGKESKVLAAGFLAGRVMAALNNFCASDDPEPSRQHFDLIQGLDMPKPDGTPTYENNNWVSRQMEPFIQAAWVDACKLDGQLPFNHSRYLKMWELSGPRIPAEFVMVDEAQDLSPVMFSIVRQQEHAQLVFVGDANQCQPPGTMVAVVKRGRARRGSRVATWKPIEELAPGELVVTYRTGGSGFRLAGRPVTKVHSRSFRGELIRARAVDGSMQSRFTGNHWCLARGASLVGQHAVYIMRKGQSFRVGAAAWSYSAGSGPLARARQEGADAIWILSIHPTRRAAQIAEASVAGICGLPTITFAPVNQSGTSQLFDQQALDEVWANIGDNSAAAKLALDIHGRDISYPLWDGVNWLTMARRPMRIRACNLLTGMEMRTFEDDGPDDRAKGRWVAVEITREAYDGPVWSLDVEHEHNYVSDGFVTFNSIYEWMGAINAIEIQKGLGLPITALTRSFRFGHLIADAANVLLDRLASPARLSGSPEIQSVVSHSDAHPAALLTRTNAGAVRAVLGYLRAGVTTHLVGGGEEIARFTRGAIALQRGERTQHPELACFESWSECQQYVKEDGQGGELRMMVDLIDEHGAQEVLRAVDQSTPEKQARVVISTAHKSKGREWPHVKISADFKTVKNISVAEYRLMYVALTRARLHLDDSGLIKALTQPVQPPLPAPAAAR